MPACAVWCCGEPYLRLCTTLRRSARDMKASDDFEVRWPELARGYLGAVCGSAGQLRGRKK